MQKNDQALLRVEHLCQYFRMGKGELRAVDNVSFDIKRGEVFGLVGESGCGKTTIGRSVIKLYNITSGDVYFKGVRISAGIRSYKDAIAKARADYRLKCEAEPEKKEEFKAALDAIVAENKKLIAAANYDRKNCDKDYQRNNLEAVRVKFEALLSRAEEEAVKLTDEKELAAKKDEIAALRIEYRNAARKAKKTRLVTGIQMIFQDPIASLDPRMTVREIIAEGLIIQGERDRSVIDERVYEMLELVGLVREHADRYPHEFSGGQRQRIGVARSIIMNPELIIADEPVSALDVSIQAQVINLLNELREKFGLTLLFIAHDLSVVKYFSDRIGVMYFGKMVELADADELFRHPLHPYTKSLLSAIPLPDPEYEKTRKRVVYNPLAAHDYSVEKPELREVLPGHFVYCSESELARYRTELEA